MMKRISLLESSREIYLSRKISWNFETVGVGTFFEASRFGCRKTILNATKVTYNKYSCAISGMSRERMKMEYQNSSECQNWEKNYINVILEIVLSRKRQNGIVTFSILKKEKRKRAGGMQ